MAPAVEAGFAEGVVFSEATRSFDHDAAWFCARRDDSARSFADSASSSATRLVMPDVCIVATVSSKAALFALELAALISDRAELRWKKKIAPSKANAAAAAHGSQKRLAGIRIGAGATACGTK